MTATGTPGALGSRFLEPATLAGIHDLRLVARTVVEGYLSGLHSDLRPSAGVEFHQYRAYEPGDDLRRVDWRAYARSDRFLVRESEVERDVTVRFLLDASASMAHGRPPVTKFDYARLLVASLAYLVDRQGDRISFHALRDGGTVDLPSSRSRRTLLHLLHLLEELEPAGAWPAWDRLAGRLASSRSRELIVVVSDLYERSTEMSAALSTMRALGHELLVLRLLHRDEIDFRYEGDVLFEDLETGETVRGNASRMKNAYAEQLRRDLESWRLRLLTIGVAHEVLPTDEPLDRALRTFLLRRSRLP